MFFAHPDELCIDAGSSCTRIFTKEKGLLLNEPSVIAMNGSDIIAAGEKASLMIGRTPAPISTVRPIKNGTITDISAAAAMFSYFLRKTIGCSRGIFRPVNIRICAHPGMSLFEKQAFAEALRATGISGISQISIVDSAVAAANGMSLNAASPRGVLIADLGSGICSSSVVSLNSVVTHRATFGGDSMDTAIADAVREQHKVIIGKSSAEYLKQAAGSLKPCDLSVSIRGRSTETGLPARIDVKSSDISAAIYPIARRIASAIRRVYEDSPPELAADIAEDGIYLTGGLSMLHGIADLITETTGIRAHTCARPFTSAAEGALLCEVIAAAVSSGTA